MTINFKFLTTALLLLVTLIMVGNAHSAPYRFQVLGSYGQAKSELDSAADTDSNTKTLALTYYLSPVDATTGPLAERAFLSKSAWLSGTYALSESDGGFTTEVNSSTVQARFVTQTDFIVELDYLNLKADTFFEDITFSDSDENETYSIGAGRYLDNSTTAILKISHSKTNDSDDDLNILSAIYRKLEEGKTPGNSFAFVGGLGYIDIESDSGYQLIVNGSYYFSDAVSASAGMLLQKIGRSESNTYFLNSEYFFTESIYGGIGYSNSSISNFSDTLGFNLNIGARF